MKVIILLALVSVALAGHKNKERHVACKQLQKADCMIFAERQTCDNKGNKYRNMCELMKAKCINYRIDRKKCPKPTTPKPTEGSGDEPTKFQEKCLQVAKIDCSQKRGDKMCDNKGRMYRNKCAFLKAKCQNEDLEKARCPRPTTTEEPQKPTRMTIGDRKCLLLAQIDCSVYKGRKTKCDKDGNIYRNKCEVEQAKCVNKDLDLESCKPDGSGDEAQFDEDAKLDRSACRRMMFLSCFVFRRDEVCDQDGKSYRNKCAFKKAQCANDKLIPKPCPEGSGEKLQTRPPKPVKPTKPTEGSGDATERFQAMCMKIENTRCSWFSRSVCGSDGKTYRNSCTLSKAACKQQEESLKVASRGRCSN